MIDKFDFNDILIKPSIMSDIESRKSINPFHDGFLPLITAPMDTVVNKSNSLRYAWLDIITCLPRGEKNDIGFESYSLKEIELMFHESGKLREDGMYLIDIANGHMKKLIEVTKLIKDKHPKIVLMVGNVANPETYIQLSEAGADFIRVGIGNGGGCFVKDTNIITIDGFKKISDIVIGDKVLTHNGKYEEVYNSISYSVTDPLIKINDTISTKNHEYYVLNKKYLDMINDENIHEYAEWVEASELDNDYLILQNI